MEDGESVDDTPQDETCQITFLKWEREKAPTWHGRPQGVVGNGAAANAPEQAKQTAMFQPPSSTRLRIPERTVAYVLDRRDNELGISVVQCLPLAKGGYGPGSVIGALGDPHRGAPPWVAVDDLQRIAMLRALTRANPQTTKLRIERIQTDFWRELAETQRLFWQDTRNEPLRFGRPQQDQLRWQPIETDPDTHRLGLSGVNQK